MILCYKILRNVLQFYVTDGNEQHIPRLALYRKMEMTVLRQTDYISYSSFIRKSIVYKFGQYLNSYQNFLAIWMKRSIFIPRKAIGCVTNHFSFK